MSRALVVPTIEYFRNRILCTDALTLLNSLPSQSVHCIVTSPPYFGLRDYQTPGQLGLEDTPDAYIARLVTLFREARRVLRDDGVFWLNLGDSYGRGTRGGNEWAHLKKQGVTINANLRSPVLPEKNLLGIPWRVALALQADGWILRSDIIWAKPNPMPESVKDRCTKAHEYVFMFAKSPRYFWDADAVREKNKKLWGANNGGSIATGRMVKAGGAMGDMSTHPKGYPLPNPLGANKKSVWTIATEPYSAAHFAVFPPRLVKPMILAGCPKDGIVLDPFMGAGTTGLVARRLGRDYVGCDLNREYVEMARKRIDQEDPTKPKELATGEKQLSLFRGATL